MVQPIHRATCTSQALDRQLPAAAPAQASRAVGGVEAKPTDRSQLSSELGHADAAVEADGLLETV
jgi:hypothetical protein